MTNAPTTFIDLINRVYLDNFGVLSIDDILIYPKDKNEYTTHLRTVLQTLKEHLLYEKLKKCELYLEEVVF